MERIETPADIAEALDRLKRSDPRLEAIHAVAGEVPLRRAAPGLPGLLRIVVGQQLSVASARAIWARLSVLVEGRSPAEVAALDDAALVGVGLSRPKIRTVRAVAGAVADGLDLAALAGAPREAVHAALVPIHGIGPWTADIWLLVCSGHPDVFPSGDLALRQAAGRALFAGTLPTERVLAAEAGRWAPCRSTAARLLWAWYGATRGRSGMPA